MKPFEAPKFRQRSGDTSLCPASGKWKKGKHFDTTLGLALRAAVAVSGYGCLVCVGKCEQQELQEKVI